MGQNPFILLVLILMHIKLQQQKIVHSDLNLTWDKVLY